MSAPTNTLVRSALVGEKEDLEDTVYRVAPEEKPFTSMIGKEKVKSVLHDWQTDTLASPNANNAAYEGDDVGTHQANTQPTRVGVYAQIFTKDGSISGTADAADLAGRETEVQRQKTKKGVELTNDMEARFMGNLASVAETPGSVPRTTAGALAWVATNDSLGAGGTSGGWSSGGVVAAAGNGSTRTLTEALLKGVLATGFAAGARYKVAFFSGTHKQLASAFTGIADTRATVSGTDQATLYAAADRYVSDFGPIDFVPHQFGLSRDVLLVNPEYWKVGTYRGVATYPLAKNGDNIRWQTIAEKSLICKNQLMGAAIRDLA